MTPEPNPWRDDALDVVATLANMERPKIEQFRQAQADHLRHNLRWREREARQELKAAESQVAYTEELIRLIDERLLALAPQETA